MGARKNPTSGHRAETRARPATATVADVPSWLVALAPIAAAVLVHGGALTGFFAADDIDFLSRALGLDRTPWGWARPLPGVLRWRWFTAWFGVHPFPHLALAWLLHVGSALLVARVVIRSGLGRNAALIAGVLFAGSSVAYTSTHWASGLGEVMATALALSALALHLECRHGARPAVAWLAGACAVAAVGSKESVLLLPLAILSFERLVSGRGTGRGALREIAGLGGLAAALVVVAWRVSPHVAGEAYALDFSQSALIANLCTYAAWLVRIGDPIRDRASLAQPALLVQGLVVLALWGLAAWQERKQAARPVSAGLSWFLLILAPVLPLTGHTYLYYLLTPLAGAAIAAGALLARLASRWAFAAPILVVALLAYVGNEALRIHERQTLAVGGIVVDRVARESSLLRRSLTDLRASHVARGDTIVLVSPYPARAVDATHGTVRSSDSGFSAQAYVPLVSALRGGRALALFIPGVTVLGMGDGIERDWERARVFRFENDGSLTDLGRGAAALDSLASDYVAYGRWADARAALERVIALGADGPEVRWRLGRALAQLGDDPGAFEQGRVLLERWPDSPRARLLRENAARAGTRDTLTQRR